MAQFIPDGGSGVASGAPNFTGTETAGVALAGVAQGGPKHPQAAGAAVSLAPATLLMPETSGVTLTSSIAGASTQSQAAGIAQTVTANLGTPSQASGAQLVQITYNLVQTNGALAASSTGSWTNPTNAQGLHNSTNATNANTLTVAASGALTLTYAAQPNKTPLTITAVSLKGYWANTAGLVGPCTYLVEYSVNGGTSWTTLQTGSATVAAGTPTTSTDLTAAIAGSWTAVAGVQVRATYTGASSATASTLTVDAFELVVTANTTQTP